MQSVAPAHLYGYADSDIKQLYGTWTWKHNSAPERTLGYKLSGGVTTIP